MKRIKFTGLPIEPSVAPEALQGAEVVTANVLTWGELAGLATFSVGQWMVADEPSVTGNVATVDFLGLPEEPGHTAEYFEILKDDGVTQVIEIVLMGPLLHNPRRLRVSAGATTSVYARVVWTEDATGFEFAGKWSPVSAVTPTVGAPVLSLSANRTFGVAPAGIQFTAELSGSGELRPYYDVRYKWTFPETGDWTALGSDFEWSRDREIDFGPVCAFTFQTPDASATVTCEATFYNPVTGQNQTVSQTIDIQVDDPDTVFAGANTITVGSTASGDDYNAADIASAATAISGVGAGSVRRLSLRRGLYFEAFTIGGNNNLDRFAASAHGTGPNPIVAGIDLREVVTEAAFSDLDAVGPYDPTDPFGTSVGSAHFQALNAIAPVTIHNCSSVGGNIAVFCSAGGTILSNTIIRDWYDYGVLGNLGLLSLVGTSIKQNPATQRLGDGKATPNVAPHHADHGPMRFGGTINGATSFSKCEIFSNNNWASTAEPQNPIRWNSGGDLGKEFYLNMCQIEGGTFGFGVNPGLGRGNSPQYLLCERFRHIGTGPGNQVATVTMGGTTFRNFILVQPDVPAETVDTLRWMLRLGVGDADLVHGGHSNPVEVYSGTMVDLRSEGNALAPFNQARVRESQAFFDDNRGYAFHPAAVMTENNIFLAPNRMGVNQDNRQAPLDMTAGRDPEYPGAIVTGMVNLAYSGLVGATVVNSNNTFVTLTGNTSGATANPYGLDSGGQVAAIMTSVVNFQVGETITVSGEGAGTFVLDSVTIQNALVDRFANSSNSTATFAPRATSSALESAASGKVALDDWNGELRETRLAVLGRAIPSAGPFEPNFD